MAFQKPYKTMFFSGRYFSETLQNIFWFLRNSCPSRLLPKSLPETRKKTHCFFIGFWKVATRKTIVFMYVSEHGLFRIIQKTIFFWFFWSLLFRNLIKKHIFIFSGFWETLVLPACFPRVPQKPEKPLFFVCFWKVAIRKTRKAIVFCMFLSMTSSESYPKQWFPTYATRWPSH